MTVRSSTLRSVLLAAACAPPLLLFCLRSLFEVQSTAFAPLFPPTGTGPASLSSAVGNPIQTGSLTALRSFTLEEEPPEPLDFTFQGTRLGSGSSAGEQSVTMSKVKPSHYRRGEQAKHRDRGFQVGEEAYQNPVPQPDMFAGLDYADSKEGMCERKYSACWSVCSRYTKGRCGNLRKQRDCKYDCFRKRRTCYWRARPNKIHPLFWRGNSGGVKRSLNRI
jgi:hypothetical protein